MTSFVACFRRIPKNDEASADEIQTELKHLQGVNETADEVTSEDETAPKASRSRQRAPETSVAIPEELVAPEELANAFPEDEDLPM